MKKALVIDWLDQYAGSERVIKSLDSLFHFDYYHTLVNIMSDSDIKKTFNDKSPLILSTKMNFFRGNFRYFLFFFPYFTKQIKIEDDVDLIISSSHAIAKNIHTQNSLHISYFQARNLKYIWEEQELYFKGIKKIFRIFIPYLQKNDLDSAQKPNYIISNSFFVKDWVKKTYGRDSVVIYPPVELNSFSLEENKEDYYVTVGRLEIYKRFDIVVDAFMNRTKKLIIIGDGSQKKLLEEKASDNIIFTGYLSSNEINRYISKAKGFVFAGIEDFGIAPVEAQACGTPVICLGKGGTKETVIDTITGIHFQEQSVYSLLNAIQKFEKSYNNFVPSKIREHSLKFSKERFEKEITAFVEEKYEIFKKGKL